MPDEAAIDEETADDLINEYAGTVNNPPQYAGAVNVDVRKQFFLQQTGDYFGLSSNDPSLLNLQYDDKVNNFLDDGNCLVLTATLETKSNGQIMIHTDNLPLPGQSDDKVLIFFKKRPDVITPDNLHRDIYVSSMLDSPVSALYHVLQKVYTPLLLKDPRWSSDFDPKLQGLMTELEKGLGSILRRQDPSLVKNDEEGGNLDSMSNILTPVDEYQYWTDVAKTSNKREEREKASSFSTTLQPLAKDFENLDSLQILDVEDVLETSYNVLDDLWKLDDYVFPQTRMTHLMDVIAHSIARYVQSKVGMLDIWRGKYSEVDLYMSQGSGYSPSHTKAVAARFREILSLRTLHKQLTQLLSHSEQDELRTAESFSVFDNINAVQYNPYTEPTWRALVKQYEGSLAPAEHRIASKLRNQLRNMNANTMQFLQEFKRYQELMRRPSIQRELIAERENLLGKISEYVQNERKAFQASGPKWSRDDFSPAVSSIYFVHHSEARFQDVMNTGEKILSDLGSWPMMKDDIKSFLEELKSYQRDQFDQWSNYYLDQLNSRELSLDTDKQVIYFERGKDMKVSYNRELLILNRDCRQLAILGFPIPQKILKANELAKKFAGMLHIKSY